jgi:plastocyanin
VKPPGDGRSSSVASLRWAIAVVVIVGAGAFAFWNRAQAPSLPHESGAGQRVRVAMRNFAFDQPQITAPVGTTVDWIDVEGKHAVQFDDGSGASGSSDGLEPGGSISRTFHVPGRYVYHCPIHGGPGGQGMSGVVVITPE